MTVQELDVLKRPLAGVSIRESVSPGQKVSLSVETVSDDDRPNIALIAFKFLDNDGDVVELSGWSHYSDAVGHYAYISPSVGGEPVQDRWSFVVPPNAVSFEAEGRQWKTGTNTALLGEFIFQDVSTGVSAFRFPSGAPASVSSREFMQSIALEPSERALTLSATYVPSVELKSVAPLSVRFMDRHGHELLGSSDLPQNPKFGSFIGLPAGPNEETEFICTIEVPKGAASSR